MLLTGAGTTKITPTGLAVARQWIAEDLYITEDGFGYAAEWYPYDFSDVLEATPGLLPYVTIWGGWGRVLQFDSANEMGTGVLFEFTTDMAEFYKVSFTASECKIYCGGTFGGMQTGLESNGHFIFVWSDAVNYLYQDFGVAPIGDYVIGFRTSGMNAYCEIRWPMNGVFSTVLDGTPYDYRYAIQNIGSNELYFKEMRFYNGTMSAAQFDSIMDQLEM